MGCSSSSAVKPVSASVATLLDAGKSKSLGSFQVALIVDPKDARLDEVRDVLARSFAGTTEAAPDSATGWVYDCTVEIGKPLETLSEARVKRFAWLAKYMVQFAMIRNGVFALLDTEGKVVAAAVVVLPGAPTAEVGCEQMSILNKVGMPPPVGDNGAACGGADSRDGKLANAMGRLHKAHAPTSLPHMYIYCLGVPPEEQSKGCGSALLGWIGEAADADGVAVWTETAGAENKAFYSSKEGFTVKGREAVVAKGDAKKGEQDSTLELLGMLRPAPLPVAAPLSS